MTTTIQKTPSLEKEKKIQVGDVQKKRAYVLSLLLAFVLILNWKIQGRK